eukprot:CAMPEP_0118665164 /NCGR_PEP_ID=MMETSP0785-20121206/18468_1 /TAXON_ID=91992 /ORGANISM="Bolidomonas pacifica, Strain CCMP 1866" /LENGTH=1555 /DNA_ID=CAMNT_0006559255 /DNA_START=726 /DNA_END=5390 /DNA_ORIENTATION=-
MSALSSQNSPPSPLPTSVNTLDITSWSSFSQYNIQYNSVHSMVAEHVWEHLSLQEGIVAARNCRFALEPGGVLMVAVPDVNSYTNSFDVDPLSGEGLFSHPMNRADIRDGHEVQYDYVLLMQVFRSGGWEADEIRIVEGHDDSGVLRLDYPEPRYPIEIKRCHANGRTGPGSSLIIQLVKRRPSSTGSEPYLSRKACKSYLPLPNSPTPWQITLLAKCFKATVDTSYIAPVAALSESLLLPYISTSLRSKIEYLTLVNTPTSTYNKVMTRLSANKPNDSSLLLILERHALLSSTFKGQHLLNEWRNFYESLLAIGQPREALRLLKRLLLSNGNYTDRVHLRMMKEASTSVGTCDGNMGKIFLNGESSRQNFKSTEPISVSIDLKCMANTPLHNPNAGIVPCSYVVSLEEKESLRRFSNCSPQYTLSSLLPGSYKIVVDFFSQPDYEEIAGSRTEALFDVESASSPLSPPHPSPTPSKPPIVFFTLCLNGLPYLNHHFPTFSAAARALNTTFQWHVVEGVAEGRADVNKPYSNEKIGDRWRSSRNLSLDGSSQVLDMLQALHPDEVFIHRRSDGLAYRDKVQMVNEVAYSLDFECVLMQVDVDEIWSPGMIEKVYESLVGSSHNCAYFDCHFFVGPGIVTTTGNGSWGHGNAEWLRAWIFKPLSFFLSHAPPALYEEYEGGWKAVENCVGKEETTKLGMVFSHYAYYEEKQAEFKSLFYGYGEEGIRGWRGLQEAPMPQKAGKWLPWLREGAKGYESRFDKTVVDKLEVMEEKLGVKVVEVETNTAMEDTHRFKESSRDYGEEDCAYSTLIDGVIFQVNPHGGISRVWKEVLRRMSSTLSPSHCVVLILRGGEGENFFKSLDVVGKSNWKTVKAPLYNDGGDFERDSMVLSSLCEKYSATWFLSTLYTFPAKEISPKVKVGFVIHDLTPEEFQWEGGIWREKRKAINDIGDALIVVSNSTGKKLTEHYELREGVEVLRSRNGVDLEVFHRRGPEEVERIRSSIGLSSSEKYILLVGERRGYKSGHALLLTLRWAREAGMKVPVVVMVGGGELIDEEKRMLNGLDFIHVVDGVDDHQLAKLYSGAVALAYLSLDEGFGLPIVEAMACGCGLILSNIDVFREVVGTNGEEGGVRFVNPALREEIWKAVEELIFEGMGGFVWEGRIKFHGEGWDALAKDVTGLIGGDDGDSKCPFFESQQGQDVWVDNALSDGERYFVELGVNDGVVFSNTLGLEKCGAGSWRGLCIEPTAAYEKLMRSGRDRCVKVKEAVSESVRKAELIGGCGDVEGLPTGGTLWAGLKEHFDSKAEVGDGQVDASSALVKLRGESVSVLTKTLQTVLEEAGAPTHVDFLSLDVEGAEVEVLLGVDWNSQSFGLIAVEHGYNEENREVIRSFLGKLGYVRAKCFNSDDGYVNSRLVLEGGELEGLNFDERRCRYLRIVFKCGGDDGVETEGRDKFCLRYGLKVGGEYCEGVWNQVTDWCEKGVVSHAFSVVMNPYVEIEVEIGGGGARIQVFSGGDNSREVAKEFCEENEQELEDRGVRGLECNELVEVGGGRRILS